MTAIVIFVHNIITADDSDDIVYQCKMRAQNMTQTDGDIVFDVPVAPTSIPSTINAAIKTAALAGTAGWDFGTVGLLDQKTLIGGAVGL